MCKFVIVLCLFSTREEEKGGVVERLSYVSCFSPMLDILSLYSCSQCK